MGKDTQINVIFDNRHTAEDYSRLIGEFTEQGISNYKFWDAIVLPDSVVKSINLSHKMIVQWAKDNNLPFVIIGEQDLYFTAQGAWDYYIKNMPNQYDIYLGATYLIDSQYLWKEPLIKVKEWVGSHLISISERYYETFLSVPDDQHIDTIHKGMGDFYVCFPFVGLQRSGFSVNNKCVVDYNPIIEKKFIYGNK